MDNKFRTRLKELREEHNISKLELSKVIGVSDVMIGYWERGRSEPTASSIIAIANYFEVSTDYLLGKTDF